MSETVTPTPAAPSSGTAGGRGSGRGRGRSGRGRGYRGNRTTSTTARARSTFKGNTKEMNGHVFQCFNECNDKKQFSKTVKAVGEYIAKKLKYPGDMDSLTKDLVLPTIPKPEELDPEETNLLVEAIWNKKVTSYCTRNNYLESNLKTTYAVIWGQCSEAMKAKLTSLDDFKTKSLDSNCIWILKEIKGITYGFEGQRYIYLSLSLMVLKDRDTFIFPLTTLRPATMRTPKVPMTRSPFTLNILRPSSKCWNTTAAPSAKIRDYLIPPMLHRIRRSAQRLRMAAPSRWRSSNERTVVVLATSGTTSRTSLPEVMTSFPSTSQQPTACWSISNHQSEKLRRVATFLATLNLPRLPLTKTA